VTFSHNLWISNQSRNPKSKGKVQFVNNVVYNWGKVGFVGGHSAGEHFVDVVGNYFIKGPSSSDTFAGEFADTDKLYQAGNMLAAGRSGKLEGRALEGADFRAATVVGKPWSRLVGIDAPDEAYRKVAGSAGCSLHRDSVDRRLIEDLTSLGNRGAVVSDPEEMGGFGSIEGGVAAKDSDGDGLPDEWEVAHGLDPHDAKDGMKVERERYAMVEIFLNGLVAGK